MEKNKRKTYFIQSSFQGRFVIHFFALILIGALLFTLLFSMTTAETWMAIYNNQKAAPGSTPFMLLNELVKSNWILVVLSGIIVAVMALLYSHRIAGPFHKFVMILEDMQKGILDPHCKLRNKDDGQEVMEQLQQTNRFYAAKVNELRSIYEKLHETVESDKSQSKEAISNLTGRLKAIIDGFTIKE